MVPPKKPVTRCLYEVLCVARDVDDDVLKKAYRKLALQWHPDKNQDRLEEAADRFKEIQNAYEILSDKHERAWYDSHREQIMRSGERHQAGGSGYEGPTRPDDDVDLFMYFSSSCFTGYGDGAKSFYCVYDELFNKLAKQEAEAFEQRSADVNDDGDGRRAPPSFPRFGGPDATAAECNAFYSQWSSFGTAKSFAWADLYNPAAATRQVRRKMEEENRKARRSARREFNEQVQELVAFVKRRDKRVARYQAEEAVRRAAKQAEDEAKRKREKEERLAAAAQFVEADWITQQVESSEDEEEEVEEVEQFFCIVCEKRFKSDKQLENHERSKKHLEQLSALRAVLQDEEQGVLDPISEEASAGSGDEGRATGAMPAAPAANCTAAMAPAKHMAQGNARAAACVAGQGQESCRSSARNVASGARKVNVSGNGAVHRGPKVSKGGQAAPAPAAGASSSEEEDDSVDGDEDAMLARMLHASCRPTKTPAADVNEAEPETVEQEDKEEDEEGDEDEDAMLARMMHASVQVTQPMETVSSVSSEASSDTGGDAAAVADTTEVEGAANGAANTSMNAGSKEGATDIEHIRLERLIDSQRASSSIPAPARACKTSQKTAPAMGPLPTTAPAVVGLSGDDSDGGPILQRGGRAGKGKAKQKAAMASGMPASRGGTQARELRDPAKPMVVAGPTPGGNDEPVSDEGGDHDGAPRTKREARKAKLAARMKAASMPVPLSATACSVCGVECGTRNQLFKHIKDNPTHAVLKTG